MLSKILIANRGEIACRIINTAKKLGVETVAIYSDIDKHSKFVDMAHSAYRVGPAPSLQSYLQADKIIELAKGTGCQGIHPGFGFLSENADFADNVNKNNIKFIGPPSSAIRKMGSKSESKVIMTGADVPVVQGYHGENQDPKYLKEQADKIGYPVLIKAVMGGGGKGMRIVDNKDKFMEGLESAKSEAKKSFNDDRVLVEKYITKPRHIEVQVFGDNFGNYVHLFERDCSIQRRHQKVIEEAPSGISSALRSEIGQSAIDAARAVGYQNAGTVEFIFDTDTNKYYFMEMNTRLQVEHPITEEITGQDLVEWQLKIASGMKLPKTQDQLSINGHAIEARIYSEDPFNNFYPHNGKLKYYKEPRLARTDSGVRQGDEISIFYDPMISKLIVHGKDRQDAINKFSQSLRDYKILGLPNNLHFLKKSIQHPEFLDFSYDTSFIEKYGDLLITKDPKFNYQDVLGAIVGKIAQNEQQLNIPPQLNSFRSGFNQVDVYMLNLNAKHVENQQQVRAKVTSKINGKKSVCICNLEGERLAFYDDVTYNLQNENEVSVSTSTQVFGREFKIFDESISVFDANGDEVQVTIESNLTEISDEDSGSSSNPFIIKAPMPSTLLKVLVKEGQKVKKDDSLAVLEAMKMEHTIKAGADATVVSVKYQQGQFVEAGALVIELKE